MNIWSALICPKFVYDCFYLQIFKSVKKGLLVALWTNRHLSKCILLQNQNYSSMSFFINPSPKGAHSFCLLLKWNKCWFSKWQINNSFYLTGDFLDSIQSPDLIQSIDIGAQSAMETEEFIVYQTTQWKIVKQILKHNTDFLVSYRWRKAFIKKSFYKQLCRKNLGGFSATVPMKIKQKPPIKCTFLRRPFLSSKRHSTQMWMPMEATCLLTVKYFHTLELPYFCKHSS